MLANMACGGFVSPVRGRRVIVGGAQFLSPRSNPTVAKLRVTGVDVNNASPVFGVYDTTGALISGMNGYGSLMVRQSVFGGLRSADMIDSYLSFSANALGFGYGAGHMVQWIAGNPGEFRLSFYNTPLTMGTGPIRGLNASGTNVVAGLLKLAPGQSTGSATPAVVTLCGTAAGASGSTAQALVDVLSITNSATMTVSDGVNIVVGSTVGTKIGTSSTQKLGLWGVTPVAQPSGANQAAVTDSTGGTASFTLSDVGASYSQSAINDNFATLSRLVDNLRSALVLSGAIKGAA